MAEKDRKRGRPANHSATEPGLSRRRVLGVAGAGAAGLAAGAFTAASPARAVASSAGTAATRPDPARPDGDRAAGQVPPGEPVVVHVANAYSGEVNIYAGTSHIKMHDPALAARLRRAAG